MLMEGIVPYEVCFCGLNGQGTRIKPLKWNEIPFDPKAGGCGAAMRAMCIGLRFPRESERALLIATAVGNQLRVLKRSESGRMTHNQPVAFFGAFVAALFTAYAIESVPVVEWGRRMLGEMPAVKDYLKKVGRDWESYKKSDLDYFENQVGFRLVAEPQWMQYLVERDILDPSSKQPKYPKQFGVKERDDYYKKISFDGWGGSSGHDSVIIAYDALLAAGDNWEEMLKRSALHGGDR